MGELYAMWSYLNKAAVRNAHLLLHSQTCLQRWSTLMPEGTLGQEKIQVYKWTRSFDPTRERDTATTEKKGNDAQDFAL